MPTLNCPQCGAPIKAENVNVVTDVASCHQCGAVFKVSAALDSGTEDSPSDFNRYDCPPGVSFVEFGDTFELTASTRSDLMVALIPITTVWLMSTLNVFYMGPIATGEPFGFAQLLGLPFLFFAAVLIAMTARSIVGEVRVSADGHKGKVFSGVGPFRRTQSFDWREVESVREVAKPGFRGISNTYLYLEGRRRGLDSHFKCNTEVIEERPGGCFKAKAFSGC